MKYIVIILLLIPTVGQAYDKLPTADEALCRCSTFVAFYLKKDFPDSPFPFDPRIQDRRPSVGEVGIVRTTDKNWLHVGIVIKVQSDGFYMISSNARGCGLSLDFSAWKDYVGVFDTSNLRDIM